MLRILTMALCLLWITGCGTGSGFDSDDTTNTDIVASMGIVGEILAKSTATKDTPPSRADDCALTPFASCNSTANTRTRSFSTNGEDTGYCLRGTLPFYGQAILTYTGPSCRYTAVGDSIGKTFRNHYFVDSSARKILIYTGQGTVASQTIAAADLLDFNSVDRSGGSLLVKGVTTDSLTISGIHRRARRSGGYWGFWHTLYTSSALTVTTGTTSSSINSGTIVLLQNRASSTITQTLTNVGFSTGCCYPTSGTVSYSVVPSSGSTTTFDAVFSSTCGSVTIDSSSVTLPTCP